MRDYIKPISQQELNQYLSVEDLTKSRESHAIKLVCDKIIKSMHTLHSKSCVELHREYPVVPVEDNYDNLLIAKDNISRSSTYTHYVDCSHVLRTHTSAHLPKILRELSKRQDWTDVLILLPGLAYRRDVSDKKHVGEVHMLEMWRIVKNEGNEPINKKDLLNVVEVVAEEAAPGWKLRIEDSPHPYTNQGIEVNAVSGDRDIEILECGLIKEEILRNAGLDPNVHSGWALGMGLDRLVMTLKDLPDVRHLRSANPKIAQQMNNLDPYIEVSNQPAIRRDLSYCVPVEYVEEDVSSDIRDAIGQNIDALEEVEILSSTQYDDLPEKIQVRLGINENQKNILVRITLRYLGRSLTHHEANSIYSEIYPKINKGSGGYL